MYNKGNECNFKGANSVTITKTCLNNFDPLKPHIYIVKLGFTGVYIFFFILLKMINYGYSLETFNLKAAFPRANPIQLHVLYIQGNKCCFGCGGGNSIKNLFACFL